MKAVRGRHERVEIAAGIPPGDGGGGDGGGSGAEAIGTSHSVLFPSDRAPPDRVFAHVEGERLALEKGMTGEWARGGVRVETPLTGDRMAVTVASEAPLRRVHLRWGVAVPTGLRLLGDHWERGYGDLEWRGVVPERPMPWFFLTYDGRRTHGYGVRTDASALAHWQVDAEGVSLWLDVRSGGRGVELKGRTLGAATVVAREGRDGESAFAAAQAFCTVLHDRPLMPASPAYGGNSWYSAYDRIDADLVRAMTDDLVALAPAGANRPFAVIDSGWQGSIGIHAAAGGPWREPNRLFPPMAKLSDEIRSKGARPGIWVRPLVTVDRVPDSWTLPVSRFRGDYPGVFRSTACSSRPTPTAPRSRRRCRGRLPSAGYGWWPRAARRSSSRTRERPSARSRRPRCGRPSRSPLSRNRRPSRSTGWRRPARDAGGSAGARSRSSGRARAGRR
jgi:hypothetical protein